MVVFIIGIEERVLWVSQVVLRWSVVSSPSSHPSYQERTMYWSHYRRLKKIPQKSERV